MSHFVWSSDLTEYQVSSNILIATNMGFFNFSIIIKSCAAILGVLDMHII